jgi:hypothetical protein
VLSYRKDLSEHSQAETTKIYTPVAEDSSSAVQNPLDAAVKNYKHGIKMIKHALIP